VFVRVYVSMYACIGMVLAARAVSHVHNTRVILKHPPHVLQLARSQPKTLGTPHVLPPSKQLLVGTPHTNSLTAYTL
jgi:hypothetical protein